MSSEGRVTNLTSISQGYVDTAVSSLQETDHFMMTATPIPYGIHDWLGYMPYTEPIKADTYSPTNHNMLHPRIKHRRIKICIVLDHSEFPADLSSILQNGVHDDIELEC